MTVVVHSSSKNATGAIKYARDGLDKVTGNKKCVAMSGFQTDVSNAEYQFSAIRKAYGKEKGNQAKIFIQSFENNDLTPQQANELGLETIKRFNEQLDGNYQAIVCTHGNTDNRHNHIIINTIDVETGLKYHAHKDLTLFRQISDEVSLEHGIKPPEQAPVKRSFAEIKLAEKGEYIWKDDLRQRIDEVISSSGSLDEFQFQLEEKGVSIKQRGSQYTFEFEDEQGLTRKARSKRLGQAYEVEEISKSLEKPVLSSINHDLTLDNQQKDELMLEIYSDITATINSNQYYNLVAWDKSLEAIKLDTQPLDKFELDVDVERFYNKYEHNIQVTLSNFSKSLDMPIEKIIDGNTEIERKRSASTFYYKVGCDDFSKMISQKDFELPPRNISSYQPKQDIDWF